VYVPGGVEASAEQTSVPPDGVQVRRVADVGIVKVPPLSVVMSTNHGSGRPRKCEGIRGSSLLDCQGRRRDREGCPCENHSSGCSRAKGLGACTDTCASRTYPVRTPVVASTVATAVVSLDQLTPLVTTFRVPSS